MAGADERNSAFDEGDSSQVLPKSPGEWPVAVPVLIGEVIPDYPPQVEVKPPIPPFPLPNGVGLRVLGRIIAFDAPGHLTLLQHANCLMVCDCELLGQYNPLPLGQDVWLFGTVEHKRPVEWSSALNALLPGPDPSSGIHSNPFSPLSLDWVAVGARMLTEAALTASGRELSEQQAEGDWVLAGWDEDPALRWVLKVTAVTNLSGYDEQLYLDSLVLRRHSLQRYAQTELYHCHEANDPKKQRT